MNTVVKHSFCRACMNSCPTLVEVTAGRLSAVRGDPANAIFGGYSCIKGQAQPALHNHPDRLLHSMARTAKGVYQPIDVRVAMDEVAERLRRIVDESGPRSFAVYLGTASSGATLAAPFVASLLEAVGSKMLFTPNTLDKPGKSLALAMHGRWGAPLHGYHDPDVALLIGANPLKTYYGAASGNPGRWLRERLAGGMQLLVIDPRRSDVAKKATMHLRPSPGHDPAILACLIGVILAENLYDASFVGENARGLGLLRGAVAPFTPELVASRAGVAAEDLRAMARRFAAAGRGYIACGVGPGFAKSSTLVEYLVLVLETLCGHWMREGEKVLRTTTLLPSGPYRAQAYDPTPAYAIGETLRVGGLTQTVAGMPTGALADEILMPGEGRVRVLFSVGGNPVISWPDQLKTLRALQSLDLFVQFDPWMSASARVADYVIAPTMFYETPGVTLMTDFVISMPTYYGPAQAHSQYTSAVVAPPEGSDVIPEWEFIYGVAQRMGLSLNLRPRSLNPDHGASGGYAVDMSSLPTADELLEVLAGHGRVPLSEVKRHLSGASLTEPAQIVLPKQPAWQGRFDLANTDMLTDLEAELRDESHRRPGRLADGSSFRLISIRQQHMNNTTLNDTATNRGRFYNPAFMHPADMRRLGIAPGDVVEIATLTAAVKAIAEPDADLLEGLVAMTFGFGGGPDRDEEFRRIGTSPGRLLDGGDLADRYVGMPRIGGVEVRVRLAGGAGACDSRHVDSGSV
jgi:anaerobic selenocysteine-containing dehydrogenase